MKVRWSWLATPLLLAPIACNAVLGYGDFTKVSDQGSASDGGAGGGADTTTSGSVPVTADGGTVVATQSACASTQKWGAPVALAALNSSSVERSATLTQDELTIFFERSDGPGTTGQRGSIFAATRASTGAAFGAPTERTDLNPGNAYSPTLSADGLTMAFTAFMPPAPRDVNLYATKRGSVTATFPQAAELGQINPFVGGDTPFLSAIPGQLFFAGLNPSTGQNDVWRATATGTDFTSPAVVTELAGSVGGDVLGLSLTPDGLTMYFGSLKSNPASRLNDVWMSARASPTTAFGTPALVPELSTAGDDLPGWISPDNCRMYLSQNNDLLVATRIH